MTSLTPDEETFLLQQPEVLALLVKFNRAAAYRETSNDKRMTLLNRKRQIEALVPSHLRGLYR